MAQLADGLPDLTAWPGVQLGGPLTGGSRSPVYRARRDPQPLVAKVSSRSPDSLAWELDLLRHLDEAGIRVPVTVSTVDGRSSDRGVVVQTFLPGEPPRTRRDWSGVAAVITRVHALTVDWPQRPGSLGIRDLLYRDTGGDVDLTAMPPDAATLIRSCWRALLEQADTAAAVGRLRDRVCVVHGDLGAGAVLIDDGTVGIIDWDEARVDVPVFDLLGVDEHHAPPGVDPAVAHLAALAWETATCWIPEPRYAHGLLDQLQDTANR